MIYQGYEDSEFWHYLGGMPDKVRPNELLSYRGPRSPRLYKICLGQGYLELPQERTYNILFENKIICTGRYSESAFVSTIIYLMFAKLNYRISADHAKGKKPQWALAPHLRLLPSLLSSKGVYILGKFNSNLILKSDPHFRLYWSNICLDRETFSTISTRCRMEIGYRNVQVTRSSRWNRYSCCPRAGRD